jgi:hypothetical protein
VSAPVALPSRPPRNEVRPLTTEVTEPAAAPAPAARTETAGPRAPADAPRAAAPPTAVERATGDARLPRFADLVVRGELNVPHMHIDIHVFSGNPDERFVFINMRRYNEGQATQEGPRVERITNDGVVMDHQGQRFFLRGTEPLGCPRNRASPISTAGACPAACSPASPGLPPMPSTSTASTCSRCPMAIPARTSR